MRHVIFWYFMSGFSTRRLSRLTGLPWEQIQDAIRSAL